MNIGLILIIVSAIGFVIAFASILFVRKKKKAPKAKVEPAIAPATKPEPEPKEESFKISRKEKGTRVSKKALSTDSRSAKVEPVFQRNDNDAQMDAVVTTPSGKNDDMTSAINALEKEERKVVSFGTLARNSSGGGQPGKRQPRRSESSGLEDDIKEFDEMGFLSSLRKDQAKSEQPKQDNKDLSEMVEMDAILNPKFKKGNKK